MAKDIGKMHFRRMDEGTDADFAVLARVHEDNIRKWPDLLMGLLTNLQADGDYPIDRLQHSLQAATRALRDGRDDEYVVCALLHDIGESLGPFNHGEVVAAVLKPSFCALYDEVSFDAAYPSEPMSTFEPMVRRVLSKDWTPPR